MKTPRHVLAQAIANRTLEVADSQELAREIAAYLITERRTNELESILRDIMQIRASHGIIEAEVATAHDLQTRDITEIKQLLQKSYPAAKQVNVGTHLDASVVGGLRIDMPEEQLDMSIAARLAKFKRLTLQGSNL